MQDMMPKVGREYTCTVKLLTGETENALGFTPSWGRAPR